MITGDIFLSWQLFELLLWYSFGNLTNTIAELQKLLKISFKATSYDILSGLGPSWTFIIWKSCVSINSCIYSFINPQMCKKYSGSLRWLTSYWNLARWRTKRFKLRWLLSIIFLYYLWAWFILSSILNICFVIMFVHVSDSIFKREADVATLQDPTYVRSFMSGIIAEFLLAAW